MNEICMKYGTRPYKCKLIKISWLNKWRQNMCSHARKHGQTDGRTPLQEHNRNEIG